jgi:hypothetical protein
MTTPPDPFATPAPGDQPPPPPYGTPTQPPYGAPGQPPPYGAPSLPPYGAPEWGRPAGGTRNGMGIAGLVLGVLSLIPPLTLLVFPGILGVVFGILGRRRTKRAEASNGGMALSGIITGSLGVLFGVAFWVFVVIVLSSPEGQRWRDCLADAGSNSSAQDTCNDRFVHEYFG